MEWLDPADDAPECQSRFDAWLAVWKAFSLAPQKLPVGFRTDSDVSRLCATHAVGALSAADAARCRRLLAREQVRLVPIASPLYPPRLARLVDAPPVLAVRGNPALLRARCVAMVGARAATPYGVEVATTLAVDFARAGWVVVSGLARGIDAAAHRGALAGGGATLAFQACGPERTYPTAHVKLARAIIPRGALVTEFPIGTPPRPPYFPLRNRLISALSEAVVVVEARIRSGSLTTARHAAEQGVDVWAVPGALGRPTSEGPLLLLRDGAGLATSADEVLSTLGSRLPPRPPSAALAPPDEPVARRVWRQLCNAPADLDELHAALSEPVASLNAALCALEIEDRVTRDRDGRFCVRGASLSVPDATSSVSDATSSVPDATSSPEGESL